MQLELVQVELERPRPAIRDPNTGLFDQPLDYFWEYAVSGAGVDIFLWGTMVTVFFISPDDVRLFPYLAEFRQVVIWEDEEEGVKMFHLKPGAKCFVCKDPVESHEVDKYGSQLCDGIL